MMVVNEIRMGSRSEKWSEWRSVESIYDLRRFLAATKTQTSQSGRWMAHPRSLGLMEGARAVGDIVHFTLIYINPTITSIPTLLY